MNLVERGHVSMGLWCVFTIVPTTLGPTRTLDSTMASRLGRTIRLAKMTRLIDDGPIDVIMVLAHDNLMKTIDQRQTVNTRS
jgi:hypothetical protein